MDRFHSIRLLFIPVVASLFLFGVCSRGGDELDDTPNTDEYFTWRIAGYNGNLTDPPDSVSHGYYLVNHNVIVSYDPGGTTNTYLSFNSNLGTGSFPATYLNIFARGHYFVSSQTAVQVTVDAYGAPGQHIIGSYRGTVKDSTGGQSFDVSGTFKVRNY